MRAIRPEALERRRALARALHARPEPAAERLRAQLCAYRARAIALNARLELLEDANPQLALLRARLLATSARLDRATGALLAARDLPITRRRAR